MKHLGVLVITAEAKIPSILNWKVSTVDTVETAIEKIQQRPYNVVAISYAFNEADKLKLSRILPIVYEDAILVEYSDLQSLSEHVKAAYRRKNKPNSRLKYLDNSFEIKFANSIT